MPNGTYQVGVGVKNVEEISLPSASQEEYKSALIGHIQSTVVLVMHGEKKSTKGIREDPESFCSCDWAVQSHLKAQAQFLAVFPDTESRWLPAPRQLLFEHLLGAEHKVPMSVPLPYFCHKGS